jgi:hypothetical protein
VFPYHDDFCALEIAQFSLNCTSWCGFKNKLEQDKSIHHKSRACAKGYKQVPGKDYMESFSPVATDTSVRAGITIYLFYADGHDGLKYESELIDIGAAFLEGKMDTATYIEWPTGMLELRFITQQEYEECSILLLKLMYGNVDAALKFFCTYKAHLLKVMGYKQSLADPCVFYKKNDKGQTVLFALIHVDDLLLVGTKEELKNFKAGIKK